MRISKKAVAPLLIWIGLILAGAIIVHNSNLKDTGDESNIELFSSLGQQAKCDIFPCKTGVFNDNKFISCCDSNSKYPGSGNCLINVFHENYAGTKPASECGSNEEVNGCVEYINSNYVSNLGVNSIYEVYNCPDGSLTSSINPGTCDCDYASTNKNCKISCNVENPICLGTCVSTGKFFKQCPNGLDGSSASCECDFSYFEDSTHQRCPSSKPYCVDNGELDYCASDVKCSKLDAVSCMANSNCIVGWYGCIDLASAKCSDIQPDKFGKYTPSSICAKKGCTLSGTQCISKKNSSVKITSITPRTESSKLIINVKWSGGVGPYIVEIEELDVYEKVNSFEYTSIVNYNGINKLNVCVYDSDYKTLNECKKLDINCIDSDLGNDIFNKGTVYYNKKSYLDECKVNSNFLEQGDQITEY